ncbi:MAG TPA: hypothetical protein VFF27_00165 [Bacteroidia bacterium]|jgi:hypothetical protein|nr:hypothetical protein [Bacteroidia bacterium]
MEEKEILLKVKVDRSDSEKALQDVTKQLIENKSALDSLTKSFKAGEASTEQYVKESIGLKRTQKELADQQKVLTKEIQAEANSLDALRLKLASLTKERNATNQGTKEGVKRAKELTEAIKSTSEAISKQEQAGGDFRRNVGNYGDSFKEAVGGVNVFGTSLGGLFKTLAANPFAIAIAGISALFNILKGFEPVFDFFERGLAAIMAGFDALVSGNNIAKAASDAYDLAQAVQDLEDNQRALNVESAKAEASVKNLIIQSKDRTKTEQDRLAILEKASQIEIDNFNKSLKLAEENLRIEKAKLTEAEKNGRANDEIRDKAAEAEIRLINLKSSSADVIEKIENRKAALQAEIQKDKDAATQKEIDDLKKIDEANKKAAEERQKLREKEKQAAQDLRIFRLEQDIKETKSIEDKIQKEIELEKIKTEFLLKNAKLTTSERALLQEKLSAKIIELNSGVVENEKESSNDLEQFRLDQAAKNAEAIDERLKAELAAEDFRVEVLLDKENLLASERTLILEQSEAKKIEIVKKAEETKRSESTKTAKIQEDNLKVGLQSTSTTLGTIAGLFQENTKAYKIFATSQALVDTYKSANAAFSSVAGIPIVGPALGIAAAGAAVAAGLANVAQINAAAGGGDFVTTKPTLLLVGDNPGGRERITVEPLSGRGKTKVHKGSGMIAMAGGGTLTTGATLTRGLSTPISNDVSNMKSFQDALINQPAPEVSVKEITNKSNRVKVKEGIKNL